MSISLKKISYQELRDNTYPQYEDRYGFATYLSDSAREALLACPGNLDDSKTAMVLMLDDNVIIGRETRYGTRLMIGDEVKYAQSGGGLEVYETYRKEDLKRKDMRIRMIGDVTCDIKGSIKSTVRPATHDDPYFDYNPDTEKDEPAFSSEKNISVMAVDTCPNALAMDTSEYFGKMLIKHVFEPLLNGIESRVINGSIITSSGELTEKFSYLENFAKGL